MDGREIGEDGLTMEERQRLLTQAMAQFPPGPASTPAEFLAWVAAYEALRVPIREVGLRYWLYVDERALRLAMWKCGIPLPEAATKPLMIRACLPLLQGPPSEARSRLLEAIRRETDAHDIKVRGHTGVRG